MRALIVGYFLAALATALTVAWALREGREAPEGAVVGYAIIVVFLWAVFSLLMGVMG